MKEEIEKLERELSDAVKGAGTINEFMRSYFGKADLKITTVDNRFQITRNNVPAKNLSEGERTAVAFAYFMTRVLDGKNPLSATTVIIDDPIGSLDANHLFNTYAFIKTKLSGCFQLFILTHNFEFYSLIREWALHEEEKRKNKPQTDWHDWSIYLIRRGDDGQSILEVIPDQLLKFNSEYHYLFATLLAFERSTQQTSDNLMSLPNMARRFLEAFGGVMIGMDGSKSVPSTSQLTFGTSRTKRVSRGLCWPQTRICLCAISKRFWRTLANSMNVQPGGLAVTVGCSMAKASRGRNRTRTAKRKRPEGSWRRIRVCQLDSCHGCSGRTASTVARNGLDRTGLPTNVPYKRELVNQHRSLAASQSPR